MNESDRINNVYEDYSSRRYFMNKWSSLNKGNKLINIEKLNLIKSLLELHKINLKNKKILDVGCAGGDTINFLKDLGGLEQDIYGIDIRENRLKHAMENLPKAKIYHMDARNIKFQDNKFDLVSAFTVFTSVVDINNRKKISNELVRVLKPGGIIIFYDFRYNNPFNKSVKGLRRKDIDILFPNMIKYIHLITLFPPLARRLGRFTKSFYSFFSKSKILRTHYSGLIIKAESY